MHTNKSSYLPIKIACTLIKTYSTWLTETAAARWPLDIFCGIMLIIYLMAWWTRPKSASYEKEEQLDPKGATQCKDRRSQSPPDSSIMHSNTCTRLIKPKIKLNDNWLWLNNPWTKWERGYRITPERKNKEKCQKIVMSNHIWSCTCLLEENHKMEGKSS